MGSLLDNPVIRGSVMPISVEQYHHLGATGLVGERTELLQGVIFQKMNKSPLHSWTVRRLRSLIQDKLPANCYLRQEEPLSFRMSEPEPDLAIVKGTITDHRNEHPSRAILVIEVAVTSKEIDSEKADIYAEAGVPEFWLVLADEAIVRKFTSIEDDRYTHIEDATYGNMLKSSTLTNVSVELGELL